MGKTPAGKTSEESTGRREFLAKSLAVAASLSVASCARSPLSLNAGETEHQIRKDSKNAMDKPAFRSNDQGNLCINTEPHGPLLKFDFPEVHVGIAEYPDGPTGCTVFYFPDRATSVADIRGGSHATYYSDYQRDGQQNDCTDAICLAGGSLYGLEASAGVTAELLAKAGYEKELSQTTGAIVWDLWRDNMIYPDKNLGRAALRSARPGVFPLQYSGIGCSTGCGGATRWAGLTHEPTGQGGAFRQIGPTKMAVFVAVNSLGVIVDREGRIVRGNKDPKDGRRYHYHEALGKAGTLGAIEVPKAQNTTLTVAVTNQSVGRLDQLAKQIHTSMARCIQPFHTAADGDILFMVTTDSVKNPNLHDVALGSVMSEVAWDAVLSCF